MRRPRLESLTAVSRRGGTSPTFVIVIFVDAAQADAIVRRKDGQLFLRPQPVEFRLLAPAAVLAYLLPKTSSQWMTGRPLKTSDEVPTEFVELAQALTPALASTVADRLTDAFADLLLFVRSLVLGPPDATVPIRHLASASMRASRGAYLGQGVS